jgi:hypothetical protein
MAAGNSDSYIMIVPVKIYTHQDGTYNLLPQVIEQIKIQ